MNQAVQTAQACLNEAYRGLRKLKHDDAGYRVLKDLFSRTRDEYFQGCNSYYRGALKQDENAASSLPGKAATLLARSQVHANQVRNAISPAPCRPEDLGLK